MNPAGSLAVVSGRSGEGKTTATLGLLRWLVRRNHTVQSFKVGPDFIDPLLHRRITGRPAPCLDGFFDSSDGLRDKFQHRSRDRDYSVVEGVMGLLDGRAEAPELDSTADVLRTLNLPYLLVLSARGRSHSLVAEAAGFLRQCPDLRCRGVVVNRVRSNRHRSMIRNALTRWDPDLPVLFLPSEPEFRIPDRHLGLHSNPPDTSFRQSIDAVADRFDDQSEVLRSILPEPRQTPGSAQKSSAVNDPDLRVGIARDEAFQFYYPANLEHLRRNGANLVSVSPLADSQLPPDLDALYLGGGYPEEHAGELASNRSFRASLKTELSRGLPTLAECGGLLYLGTSLPGKDGSTHPGVGWFEFETTMGNRPRALGYVRGTLSAGGPLTGTGDEPVVGHEFHYARIEPVPDRGQLELDRGKGFGDGVDGLLRHNVLGCFAHLYFPSCGSVVGRWMEKARRGRNRKPSVPPNR